MAAVLVMSAESSAPSLDLAGVLPRTQEEMPTANTMITSTMAASATKTRQSVVARRSAKEPRLEKLTRCECRV